MPKNNAISAWPPDERPREKLMHAGPDKLTDAELLAIILGSGFQDVTAVELARKILMNVGGLAQLGRMTVESLMKTKGIGTAKAVSIAAAFQIGIRYIEQNSREKGLRATSSRDIYERYGPSMRLLNHEIFKILLLNTNNVIFREIVISVGNLNASVVHAREVFKSAIDHLAASIVLMHNHPSGNPKPSEQDKLLTEKLVESGKIIGIPVLDHIIIGDMEYRSFADMGLI